MKKTAMVLTLSDKGAIGQREDTSGPAIAKRLLEEGWEILDQKLLPDDQKSIEKQLIGWTDNQDPCLILTTGGTGFSPRDVTPEATGAVIHRAVLGVPEAMRACSMKITSRGMLSRGTAGIRHQTLIVNLPGSKKAAIECLEAVLDAITHGIEVMRNESQDCGEEPSKFKI